MELIAYISSDSVTVTLVSPHQKPLEKQNTQSMTVSRAFDISGKPDSATLTLAAHKSLVLALHELFAKKKIHVASALIIIESPWVTAFGKTVSIRQERPFVLTEKFLQGVMQVELENSIRDQEGDHTDVLEHHIVGAKIRGYNIPRPENQTADQCDLSFFVSTIDREFHVEIAASVREVTRLPLGKIMFHSAALTSFAMIQNMWHPSEALHIHISGELTDLQIISEGLVKNSASFPCGSKVFVRRLSQILDVSERIAQSSLNLFTSGRASEAMQQKVHQAVDQSEQEWMTSIKSATTALAKGTPLPTKIFLTGPAETKSLFAGFLGTDSAQVSQVDFDLYSQVRFFFTSPLL